MALNLSSIEKSVEDLRASLDAERLITAYAPPALRATVRSGIIQNFQITYEQCWKFMKRWLEHQGLSDEINGVSRRELFRVAAQNGLIDDVELWFTFHKSRNETSHTYNQTTADTVHAQAAPFLCEAARFLTILQERNVRT